MDVLFEKNRLNPNDPNYEWDKKVDFEAPTETNEWDDDDDEEEF